MTTTIACSVCGRFVEEGDVSSLEVWPYGDGVRPTGIPEHVHGIVLPVCRDREACKKHLADRRMHTFITACRATKFLRNLTHPNDPIRGMDVG